MQVTVDVTIDDFRALQTAALARLSSVPAPPRTTAERFVLCVSVLCALVFFIAVARHRHGVALVLGVSGLIGVWASILAARMATLRTWRPSERGSLLGEQTVELTDSSFICRSLGHACEVAWPSIHAIEETDQHFFFFTDRVAGAIVPKRAFASTEAAERFASRARELHARAAG